MVFKIPRQVGLEEQGVREREQKHSRLVPSSQSLFPEGTCRFRSSVDWSSEG